MKKLFQILIVLALILLAAFFVFRTPDSNREAMIAQYTNAASKFVDDGVGGKIHYRDEGERDGVPIILIHGSNGHLQTWESLVASLDDRYRLISLDLHGHGLTGPHKNNDYSADANIAAITRVMDEIGVDKAFWVGNSMGGWLTWRAGLAVPDRVSGLIIIAGSGAQTEEKGELYLGARLAQSALGQALLPHITPRSLVRSSLKDNYADPEKISDDLVMRYWEMLRFPGNRMAAVDRAKTDREPEKWNEVGNIKAPVLLLWGKQDRVVPVSHGKAFEAAISESKLIVYPDAGHLPMEETPERVASDIGDWIETVTESTTGTNQGNETAEPNPWQALDHLQC